MYKPLDESIGLIYFDLISPQFVCSSLIRCLRTYVYPSLEYQHKFENVYYLPVEKQKITNIGIEVLTRVGGASESLSGVTRRPLD